MKSTHVVIVGAGPGGLTSAMILTHRGYRVTVFEKDDRVGGRNQTLQLGDYVFDTGPTFLMMTFILREVFREAGEDADKRLPLVSLDPMYRLNFSGLQLDPTSDPVRMESEIERHFPGSGAGLRRFYAREKVRFDKMYPCLRKPYDSLASFLSPSLLSALPYMSFGKSIYQNLGRYFKDERLKTSFTFQAKYLGMSPWECPAAFTMISYIEHAFGIDHVEGGLSRISEIMADVVREKNGEIRLDSPVERVCVQKGKATGVRLRSGETVPADAVIVNADFGHAATRLFDPGVIRKYSPDNLARRKISCSTFMLYLGLDTCYAEPHHQIVFAEDYRTNIEDIVQLRPLSEDFSFYVRNASVNDAALAPPGHSAVYILVPVANRRSGVSWDAGAVKAMRDRVLKKLAARTSMTDVEAHIREERAITPADWEERYCVYHGATFNLSHNLGQMLYFRPHNRFEEVEDCYLAGGGTHPGSGLPTIYESGRITADLITRRYPL